MLRCIRLMVKHSIMWVHDSTSYTFRNYLPFSFSVPLKGEKIKKEGVDKLASSVYFVTQETHDTISYAPR